MANGMNYLIAQGVKPTPFHDFQGDVQNALRTQMMGQQVKAFPEEQNWLRKSRQMETEKFGMEKEKFELAKQNKPFANAKEAFEYMMNIAPMINYQNYPLWAEKLIKRGLDPELLPMPTIFEQMAQKHGIAPEQVFGIWKDNAMITGKQQFELMKKQTEGKTETPTEYKTFYSGQKAKGMTDEQIDKAWEERQVRITGEKAKQTPSPYETFYNEAKKQGKPDSEINKLWEQREVRIASAKAEIERKMPAEQAAKIGELETLLTNIAKVKSLYKADWVGPIAGRKGAIGEKYFGTTSDKQNQFYAYVRDMKDALLRARSGAQINEQEYKRLVNFLPDENLPPSTFMSRLNRFEESLNIMLSSKRKALGEGGYRTGKGKESNKDPLGIR